MYRGWWNTAAFSTEFSILHRELSQKYIFAFNIFQNNIAQSKVTYKIGYNVIRNMVISCLVQMVNLFHLVKVVIFVWALDTSTVILVWKFDLQDDYQQEGKFYWHWIFY